MTLGRCPLSIFCTRGTPPGDVSLARCVVGLRVATLKSRQVQSTEPQDAGFICFFFFIILDPRVE